MAINILELPREILLLILCCLSTAPDILSAQLSCRTLRQIVHESDLVQYILQLAIAGLEDFGNWSSATSISDRVEALKRRQRAWAQLEWQSTIRIQHPDRLFRAHSFQIADSYLVMLEDNGLIYLTALPSNFRTSTSHTRHWDTIQIRPSANMRVPLARAENDLLVIVTMLVSALSFIGTYSHARASGPPKHIGICLTEFTEHPQVFRVNGLGH